MRKKKKFPLRKWFLAALIVGIIAGAYWLSLERASVPKKVDAPIELKLQKID